ncbi:MAG: hypothetical protein GX569_07750 [Candidatus Riflebacteria bacterium]|nr:hypothetical protein [Candidatus Riflebacteria bacterium]
MKRISVMILFLLAFCAASAIAADEYQWETVIRIKTPAEVWKAIAGIEELQPVISACADKTWNLLSGELFMLPENFSPDDILYVAIGRNKDRRSSVHALWSEKSDGTRLFLGAYGVFLSYFERYQHEHPLTSEGVPFPEVFATLDQNAIIHLRFFPEHAVADLSGALSAELTGESKKLDYRCKENLRKLQRQLRKGEITGLPATGIAECPLQGKYSFDEANKKFACSHQLQKPDLAAAKFEGYEQAAYDFLKKLQGLKSFEIKVDSAAEKLVFEVDITGEPTPTSGYEFALYSIPGWYDGVADLQGFAQSASMHLVIAPDFVRFVDNFRRDDPEFFERMFAGRKPEEFLPQGPMLISLFGDMNLRGYSLPSAVVSAGITSEKLAALKDFAISQGMPAQSQKTEIYGREVDLIELPVERHAFNRQQSDQRLFIMAENAHRMAVCVGEPAAREKLAMNCGERDSAALFTDIRLPVKLALAYRADGLGQALLQHVNSVALQYEAKECASRLTEWKKANDAAFAKLRPGDSIPEDLARLCPRNGYFVAGESEYDRVRCAVHSYRGFREVQMQFVKAEIPVGRWLRACITKDGSKRRLTLDFFRPAEVK